MKTIKIDQNSWHYKILLRYNQASEWNQPADLCDYRGRFLSSIAIMLLVATTITLFIVAPILNTCLWALASYNVGHWDINLLPDIVVGWWILVLLVACFAGVCHAIAAYETWSLERQPVGHTVEPGVFSLMYQAARKKFCVKIEIV